MQSQQNQHNLAIRTTVSPFASDADRISPAIGIKRANSSDQKNFKIPTISKYNNMGSHSDAIMHSSFKKAKPDDNHGDQSAIGPLSNQIADDSPMNTLLARLGEQSKKYHSSGSGPLPALSNETSASSATTFDGSLQYGSSFSNRSSSSSSTTEISPAELQKVKADLEAANRRIDILQQEAEMQRNAQKTLDQLVDSASDTHAAKSDVSEQTIAHLQSNFNAATRPASARDSGWQLYDEHRSDSGEIGSQFGSHAMGVSRNGPYIWGNGKSVFPYAVGTMAAPPPAVTTSMPAWNGSYAAAVAPVPRRNPNFNNHSTSDGFRGPGFQGMSDHGQFSMGPPMRNPVAPSRPASAMDVHFSGWGSYGGATDSMDAMRTASQTPMPISQMNGTTYAVPPNFPQPRQANRLAPTAPDFDAMAPLTSASAWNAQVSKKSTMGVNNRHLPVSHPRVLAQPTTENVPVYVHSSEPMNYRRLLDRNMNANWKYIVDKIVCNNDQQASIFLQQKLKVGTTEQKYDIVEAIIAQCFPLMTNRFGNFLVQRCFEHGTSDQIIAIANTIRGNVLTLSMDAFGCHVIQKAFDAVPEEYKAIMVHELLRRIPETVVHRYACHVWQKLFELRWSDTPPQIMKYVNEALQGMWHEVALGETGSLVVQNIFENCLEEDKRPCINEVLGSIDVISHGQFGNWCIQHICEHGSPPDRTRAIDHILRFSTEYSCDQYASKVVEKCLKIGGNEFLDRYLDRVCEAKMSRPRMPLIDIAGDQFGNYLIQWILLNTGEHYRNIVSGHVRKHMVSLRGSKYGSRVAMLCCNPASHTRPGPPNLSTGRQFPGQTGGAPRNPLFGAAYR